MSDDAVSVSVKPAPDDFRIDPDKAITYHFVQDALRGAIELHRRSLAISLFLSGVTRELRRHMPAEAVAAVFRGFADTMLEAAKGDLPSPDAPPGDEVPQTPTIGRSE